MPTALCVLKVAVILVILDVVSCVAARQFTRGAVSSSASLESPTEPDVFDPAECAAVSAFSNSTIAAHRWYFHAVKAFESVEVLQLYCEGEHCDPERRPAAVHCNLVEAKLPGQRGAAFPTTHLRWQCEVVRPARLPDIVQFHGIEVQCQSVVDGTVVTPPPPGATLTGHRRLLAKDALRIKFDDFAVVHEETQTLYGYDAMPSQLVVAKEAAEWNPFCAYRVGFRRVSLHDMLLFRAHHAKDPEAVASSGLALTKGDDDVAAVADEDGTESDVTSGVALGASSKTTAKATKKTYVHDTTIAAEVCRVKFNVHLVIRQSALVSLVCLVIVLIAFYFVVVCGLISKKSRQDVARARTRRALQEAEADAIGRSGGLAEQRAQLASADSALVPDFDDMPEGGGLTADEYMLRAELKQSRVGAATALSKGSGAPTAGAATAPMQVPRHMSAAQFIRQQQQASRGSGATTSRGGQHTSISGLPLSSSDVPVYDTYCIDEVIQ